MQQTNKIISILCSKNIMSKTNKTAPKTYCDRYRKHLRAFNGFDKSIFKTVKKVVVSKKISLHKGDKSLSTGVVDSCRHAQVTTPKKTAKSDLLFSQNMVSNTLIDYCKRCGDVPSGTQKTSNISKNQLQNPSNCNKIMNSTKIESKNNCEKEPIQQHYRNVNFYNSSHSLYTTDNIKKISLNTIMEHPQKTADFESGTIYELYPSCSKKEFKFMDPDDNDNIQMLKSFRKKNYFECHSVKSRINSKASVTSLNDHKCVYRFYLNDRLFPVPLNTDHQENIRCVECYLPLENNFENSNLNGTVQAKVKLNGKVQDTLLMLPVKNSLIVKERRRVLQEKKDYDSLYFGIIKLDVNGDSIFNRNLPSNSLALRYQKGYKELSGYEKYEYHSVGKEDTIIV